MKTNLTSKQTFNNDIFEDSYKLKLTDGQELISHPFFQFSKEQWLLLKEKDRHWLIVARAKHRRKQKKASKSIQGKFKDPFTVIISNSPDTMQVSHITDTTSVGYLSSTSNMVVCNELLHEEEVVLTYIQSKVKTMGRDDIIFVQGFYGSIVIIDFVFIHGFQICTQKKSFN